MVIDGTEARVLDGVNSNDFLSADEPLTFDLLLFLSDPEIEDTSS